MPTPPDSLDSSRPQARRTAARVAIVAVVAAVALVAGLTYSANLSDDEPTDVVAAAAGLPFDFSDLRGLDVPEPGSAPTTTTTAAPPTTTQPPATTTTAAAPPPTAAPTTTAPPPPPPPTTAPPSPPPATAALPAPPSGYTRNTSAEAQFVSLMNQARGGRLNHSGCIGSNVAAPWAKHMADTGTLAHSSTYASKTSQCLNWSRTGENVGHGGSVASIHQAFMASTTHRNNIMGDYNHVGVGVYQSASGEMWVAVNFAKA